MKQIQDTAAWAVIGAGAAGITAVGQLLDHGIAADDILWLDPSFKVGDLGEKWRTVPSNTKVRLFLDYLQGCKAFNIAACPQDFALFAADPEETCLLNLVVEPLEWVTQQLLTQVQAIPATVQHIQLKQRCWHLETNKATYKAQQVILAIGSDAQSLTYPNVTEISLENALAPAKLQQHCQADDRVAVFGSSHSAMLVLKGLLEQGVKQVINFYRHPLRYAVELKDWILFNDSGLKGNTALWARENIDGTLPPHLQRYLATPEHINTHLPSCNKVVYAIGFKKRLQPSILGYEDVVYDPYSGIIAPGLFGVGIAFPEAKANPFGLIEYRVGLFKFQEYLKQVMPVWLKYGT